MASVALFAGRSGTGKTLAAEGIAEDLGAKLLKVDLAGTMSKYIGETEKNLNKLFDEAMESSVVLLFDEADALFGKRTSVKDAHDRYANIESNFLLQRLEKHPGVVILATNRKRNIDQSFLRRLDVVVEFPLPTDDERLRVWASRLELPKRRSPRAE